jgi:hypothetical protein
LNSSKVAAHYFKELEGQLFRAFYGPFSHSISRFDPRGNFSNVPNPRPWGAGFSHRVKEVVRQKKFIISTKLPP